MKARDLFDLTGKVSLVTGGARGIGRACAQALAEMGSDIALLDIHQENMQRAAAELKGEGVRVAAVAADVTDAAAVNEAVGQVVNVLGRLDVLVNSAGIAHWAKAEEMTEEDWDRVVDVDLKGTFLCCQAAGRVMIAQRSGAIINIASMSAGIINKPQPQCHYNAAKAGVVHLTRSLAVEWAPHNVRVNCISPGYTATEMTMTVPDYHPGWVALIPMGRMAEPRELAGTVIYLASAASSYTTGHDLVVDGGYSLW
jgi:NAD(P)-dependent dehydrogenase (short-subunit alcohol dehydrogenase family)